MARALSILLGVAIVLTLSITTFAVPYSGGSGNAADPYQISTVTDWQKLIVASADWNKQFILTADLDFAGAALTPVGNSTTGFTGVLDGAGHTLSHFVIHQPGADYVGLFGYVKGGEVKNLDMVNADIRGDSSVGGLVGENCGMMTSCHANGTVSGDNGVGGLVGNNCGGTITSCYANGAVIGFDYYVGGLVGFNNGGTISSCYATGNIHGTGKDVGGLVGYNGGTISSCYASGAVRGIDHVGGLCGHFSFGTTSDCFWDIQTSGQTTSTGGTGKTTAEMKTLATFTDAGWDFTHMWIMPCEDYPHLRWEKGYSGGSGMAADWGCPDGVGTEDLLYLAARWLADTPAVIGAADLNGDGRVDLADFALFAQQWMK